MQSLRDKLLKAGLVSEEAAKKAESEKKAPPKSSAPPRRDDRPPPRRDDRPPPPRRDDRPYTPREDTARLPKFAPLPGSKEAHRLQAKKQLESDRTLRERVLATQVPKETGETPFYFVTRKNKLRRLERSADQAKKLETGELAVVERPDPDQIEHALIPADVARELLPNHPKAVRFLNAPGAAVGFLSETEISSRSHEATTGETHESHDEAPAEPAAETPAPAAEPEAPATFITIKRAPKPE